MTGSDFRPKTVICSSDKARAFMVKTLAREDLVNRIPDRVGIGSSDCGLAGKAPAGYLLAYIS